MNNLRDENSATNPLTIKIIGVGGAGVNIVKSLMATSAGLAGFAVVHTNARMLEGSTCPEKILLGRKSLRGLGAAGDPELGRAAAEEEAGRLKDLCAGADLVIIVAGLGGGTATGVAPVLARVARESQALVLGVVCMPFAFEGQRRQRQSQVGLARLRTAADAVMTLHNEKVGKLLSESTRALEVLDSANELWADGVRGLLQMLTRRGLINVDFADLSAALRGRSSESCFASVEAAGELRSKELIERILAHPLLDGGLALSEADALLVSLTGGPDMTMADVTRVTEQLSRQPENAHFVMGASVCESLTGKLRAMIIASRHGRTDAECEDAPAPAELESKSGGTGPLIDTQFFSLPEESRASSRLVPPAPELPEAKKEGLFAEQGGRGGRVRKAVSRFRQGQLPLEIVSKGRFEKSQPTIHRGEDLDVPTYIRRGIKLN